MPKVQSTGDRLARIGFRTISPFAALIVAVVAVIAVVGAAPATADDGCASCTYFENSLAPARAILDNLRQARDQRAQELNDAIGEALSGSGQHDLEEWRKIGRDLKDMIENLDKVIAAQQSWVDHLEAARSRCQQGHCSAGSGASEVSQSFSVTPGGEYSYKAQLSDECFREFTTLERLYAQRDRLEQEVAAAQAAADRVRDEHEQLTGLMMQSMDKVEIDESYQYPDDTAAQIRAVRFGYQAMLGMKLRREDAEAKLQEALDRLEALREEIRKEELGLEECEDEAEEPTSFWDRFDVWAGVSATAWSWDHPQEAVGSFLDAVDVPGATETSSSDTEDTTAGIEVGIRLPVLRKRCGTFSVDLSLAFFEGPSFSSRGEIGLKSGGVMLDAITEFAFESDEIVAPQLALRYESNHRFYFETGMTYFETPMELRITESFFLNGQLDEQMVSRETIDDSGFGFAAELGWAGERWNLGLGYRQVEINSADLEALSLTVKYAF